MNFQKYSTTNITGTSAVGMNSSNGTHFSNLNSSMGYVSNSSMKRQSSNGAGHNNGNTR